MRLRVGFVGDATREEEEVREEREKRMNLLKNIRESLGSDSIPAEVENHPAVLAQEFYVRALEWVLEGES